MTEAKLTWSLWQALLNAFAWAFTRRGFHHFAEWITALVEQLESNWDRHCYDVRAAWMPVRRHLDLNVR